MQNVVNELLAGFPALTELYNQCKTVSSSSECPFKMFQIKPTIYGYVNPFNEDYCSSDEESLESDDGSSELSDASNDSYESDDTFEILDDLEERLLDALYGDKLHNAYMNASSKMNDTTNNLYNLEKITEKCRKITESKEFVMNAVGLYPTMSHVRNQLLVDNKYISFDGEEELQNAFDKARVSADEAEKAINNFFTEVQKLNDIDQSAKLPISGDIHAVYNLCLEYNKLSQEKKVRDAYDHQYNLANSKYEADKKLFNDTKFDYIDDVD